MESARRAAVSALVEVTFLRTDRAAGRFFDHRTVIVKWKGS